MKTTLAIFFGCVCMAHAQTWYLEGIEPEGYPGATNGQDVVVLHIESPADADATIENLMADTDLDLATNMTWSLHDHSHVTRPNTPCTVTPLKSHTLDPDAWAEVSASPDNALELEERILSHLPNKSKADKFIDKCENVWFHGKPCKVKRNKI